MVKGAIVVAYVQAYAIPIAQDSVSEAKSPYHLSKLVEVSLFDMHGVDWIGCVLMQKLL
jgi:hypothetical protein